MPQYCSPTQFHLSILAMFYNILQHFRPFFSILLNYEYLLIDILKACIHPTQFHLPICNILQYFERKKSYTYKPCLSATQFHLSILWNSLQYFATPSIIVNVGNAFFPPNHSHSVYISIFSNSCTTIAVCLLRCYSCTRNIPIGNICKFIVWFAIFYV